LPADDGITGATKPNDATCIARLADIFLFRTVCGDVDDPEAQTEGEDNPVLGGFTSQIRRRRQTKETESLTA
jgi:hypothetical protein